MDGDILARVLIEESKKQTQRVISELSVFEIVIVIKICKRGYCTWLKSQKFLGY